MKNDDSIKDKKVHYDINREAAKNPALSSGKTDRYQYFTGEETLLSNQRQIAEPTKCPYSPLENVFDEIQTEKQACANPF